jgi:hypothetical protein
MLTSTMEWQPRPQVGSSHYRRKQYYNMKKDIELASKATADLMNNSIFNISGPMKSLAGYLGSTGEYTQVGESCSKTLFQRLHPVNISRQQCGISVKAYFLSTSGGEKVQP